MKVEVAVLGSPSLISLMVSVDVQHHERKNWPPWGPAGARPFSRRVKLVLRSIRELGGWVVVVGRTF